MYPQYSVEVVQKTEVGEQSRLAVHHILETMGMGLGGGGGEQNGGMLL